MSLRSRAIEAIVLVVSTADLREVELDPIWEVDADAMFSPSRGASDRSSGALKHVRDHDACLSALDVHIKLDAFVKRGMDGA